MLSYLAENGNVCTADVDSAKIFNIPWLTVVYNAGTNNIFELYILYQDNNFPFT